MGERRKSQTLINQDHFNANRELEPKLQQASKQAAYRTIQSNPIPPMPQTIPRKEENTTPTHQTPDNKHTTSSPIFANLDRTEQNRTEQRVAKESSGHLTFHKIT
ncbi:hypothetical protein EAE96_010531 [Botrytis aclada]|nr:hypothetical protein EAE96_010531 [Botrytis aclada]